MESSIEGAGQSRPIRVVIGAMSGVLAQLVVQSIGEQADMVLLGVAEDRIELLAAARLGADVVILDAPRVHPPPGVCSHLLSECPELRIVVLSTSGEAATVYWLGLRRRRLRTVSAETLTGAIRRAYALNATV
jgi:DNA-binding NarL/FixJ family response regulator